MKCDPEAAVETVQHRYHTVIVGAGAAGMNCARRLCRNMALKGVPEPEKKIAIITRGLPLGASRMSGSDKQTYYKLGTSPDVADSPVSFAESLTAAGCCHGDLALIEGIGSLQSFYSLVDAGVPFPHNSLGSHIGYKTDHDPFQRGTSAGPKTSKMMSECLERIVRDLGIDIFDRQEVLEFIKSDASEADRITAVAGIDARRSSQDSIVLNVFTANNFILAAGGPGGLYMSSVYPKGQLGLHGCAFKAGLAAENLTESQFGLSSVKFRWNVSGTYMQCVPRIYSTDAKGGDPREFLADHFPSAAKMASNIFLKGYQWPFDPQRIEDSQSSLIDILVFNETLQGRRIFMDFMHNPPGLADENGFNPAQLEDEAREYLEAAGADQQLPIERLRHMNPLAIDIYREHDIDLAAEPLEIAVCAQHNNGGFSVNKWWESSIPHTFVIGEMAGTHGVKRPGGSALNAGQVGGLRAAEYIVNRYCGEDVVIDETSLNDQVARLCRQLTTRLHNEHGLNPQQVVAEIQERMTSDAGHIRSLDTVNSALADAVSLYKNVIECGFNDSDPVAAIQAEQLSLASLAYLKAIAAAIEAGGGSRGSHLVLSEDGIEIDTGVLGSYTEKPLRFKPEEKSLREYVFQLKYNPDADDLFDVDKVSVRKMEVPKGSFENLWADYRNAKIYD